MSSYIHRQDHPLDCPLVNVQKYKLPRLNKRDRVIPVLGQKHTSVRISLPGVVDSRRLRTILGPLDQWPRPISLT